MSYRRLVSLTTIALVTVSIHAATANAEAPVATIAVEPAVNVPIGDFSDAFGIGFGGSAIYQRPLAPQFALTGRAGLIYHLEKNNATLLVVPLLGGARYYVGPGHRGLYVAAEAGLNWGRGSASALGQTVSDTDIEFGMALAGGFDMSAVDVRAGLNFYDLGEADDSMTLMVTASFDVASL